MLMVGAGDMAGPLIEAFTALRPSLHQVRTWNRTGPSAEKLVADLQIGPLTVVCLMRKTLATAETIESNTAARF